MPFFGNYLDIFFNCTFCFTQPRDSPKNYKNDEMGYLDKVRIYPPPLSSPYSEKKIASPARAKRKKLKKIRGLETSQMRDADYF